MYLLVILLGAAAAAAQGAAAQGNVAIFESTPPEAVQRGRSALEKWTEQAASEAGLVNALLGNTCFTAAIAALNKESTCTQLTNEQRCWLAIQFTMCFQRASGFKVLGCPLACPRRRALQSCVQECTAKMDDRSHLTYSQFFSDVLNMCLFLQTQNFQQMTAALVQDMQSSTTAANASLAAIREDLSSQSKTLQRSLTALTQLQAVQSNVQAAVQDGLTEVKAVRATAVGLQRSMNTSLEMTSDLGKRQQQLLEGFDDLEQQHQQHAQKAAAALNQLAEGAAALEQRQARYESLQAQLLNASESLLGQSAGMHDLLRVLAHYQQTGNTILGQLQGSSTTLHDVLFYTVALFVPLVFLTHPPDVRLLLLAGVLTCWGCERAVTQHYVMIIGAWGGRGSSSSSSTSVQLTDVKIAVRLVVLGGAVGLVVWLLAKRRAAHNRREAIFHAIQKSLEEARQQAAASCWGAVSSGQLHSSTLPPALHLPYAASAAPAPAPVAAATPAGLAGSSSRKLQQSDLQEATTSGRATERNQQVHLAAASTQQMLMQQIVQNPQQQLLLTVTPDNRPGGWLPRIFSGQHPSHISTQAALGTLLYPAPGQPAHMHGQPYPGLLGPSQGQPVTQQDYKHRAEHLQGQVQQQQQQQQRLKPDPGQETAATVTAAPAAAAAAAVAQVQPNSESCRNTDGPTTATAAASEEEEASRPSRSTQRKLPAQKTAAASTKARTGSRKRTSAGGEEEAAGESQVPDHERGSAAGRKSKRPAR